MVALHFVRVDCVDLPHVKMHRAGLSIPFFNANMTAYDVILPSH